VAVVIPLNNFQGPADDTVTAQTYYRIQNTAKYEKKHSARRSTPRHPITMASTAEPPDPMSCALAAILLPESRTHGCHMQKGLFPGT